MHARMRDNIQDKGHNGSDEYRYSERSRKLRTHLSEILRSRRDRRDLGDDDE
jgi:hypothetical protein